MSKYFDIPIDQNGRPVSVMYAEVSKGKFVPMKVSDEGELISRERNTTLETSQFDVEDDVAMKVLEESDDRSFAIVSNTSMAKNLYLGVTDDIETLKSEGAILFPGQGYNTKTKSEIFVVAESGSIDVRIVEEKY